MGKRKQEKENPNERNLIACLHELVQYSSDRNQRSSHSLKTTTESTKTVKINNNLNNVTVKNFPVFQNIINTFLNCINFHNIFIRCSSTS